MLLEASTWKPDSQMSVLCLLFGLLISFTDCLLTLEMEEAIKQVENTPLVIIQLFQHWRITITLNLNECCGFSLSELCGVARKVLGRCIECQKWKIYSLPQIHSKYRNSCFMPNLLDQKEDDFHPG